MTRVALVALVAAPAVVAGLISAPACSTPSRGALMLALTTDMQVPKDIDLIAIVISTSGVVKLDYLARALPLGTVSLPATLPIVQPDQPNAPITIRVVAFQTLPNGTANARVIRDIVTTVPDGRTVLLNVPLSFLDTDSVPDGGTLMSPPIPDTGGDAGVGDGVSMYNPLLPGVLLDTCHFQATGMTTLVGSCGAAGVDAAGLPLFASSAVFGDAGASLSCFDVKACFLGADAGTTTNPAADITASVTASCTFQNPRASSPELNLSLSTTDGTGLCVSPGLCVVTLETGPANMPNPGFQASGTTVTLVPEVCNLIHAGSHLYLNPEFCPSKLAGAPPCQPGEDGGTSVSASPGDAGHDAGHAIDAGHKVDAGPPPGDASTCALKPGSYTCPGLFGGTTTETLNDVCNLAGTYSFLLESNHTIAGYPGGTWMPDPSVGGFSLHFSDDGINISGNCTPSP